MSLLVGAVILSLGLAWAGLFLSYLFFLPYSTFFGPSPALLSYVGSTAALGAIGVPVFLLMMWFTRWFSKYRLPSNIKVPLRIIWVVCLLICGYMIMDISFDHNQSHSITTEEVLNIEGNNIKIEARNETPIESYSISRFFFTRYSKKGLVNENIDINVLSGDIDQIKVETIYRANGKDLKDATKRAREIEGEVKVIGNTILLPKYFLVNKTQKLRNQGVTYNITVPVGTSLKLGENTRITGRSLEERCNCHQNSYTWIMGNDGLYAPEWQAKYRATENIDIDDAEIYNFEGNYEVKVIKSNSRKATLQGYKSDFKKIKEVKTANSVTFLKDGNFRGKPKMTIYTPSVEQINATDLKAMSIEGFEEEQMKVIFDSYGVLDMYVDVKDLNLEISGRGKATLIGSGKNLSANLNGGTLNAEKFMVENANIKGYSNGTSKVYASKLLTRDQELDYRLEVFGNPTSKLSAKEDN